MRKRTRLCRPPRCSSSAWPTGATTRPSARSCRSWSRRTSFNAINFSLFDVDPSNSTAMATSINGLICPSDTYNPTPLTGAQTNYMADMGSGIVWQSNLFAPNTSLPAPSGVFYGNSATRFAEITDGLSNTGFYCERIVGDGTTGIITPLTDVFFDPGAPLTPADAIAQCLALNIYNPANQIPDDHGSALDRRPAHFPPRHDAEHTLVRVFHRQPCGHAPLQQPPGRRQHAVWRWLGQVHQELDQSADLERTRDPEWRRSRQRGQFLTTQGKKR